MFPWIPWLIWAGANGLVTVLLASECPIAHQPLSLDPQRTVPRASESPHPGSCPSKRPQCCTDDQEGQRPLWRLHRPPGARADPCTHKGTCPRRQRREQPTDLSNQSSRSEDHPLCITPASGKCNPHPIVNASAEPAL